MRGSSNSMVHHYNYGIDELAFFDNGEINKPVVLLIHGLEKIIISGKHRLTIYLSTIE